VPGEDPRVDDVRAALALPTREARTRALLAIGVQTVAIERDAGGGRRPPRLAAEVLASHPDLEVVRLDGEASLREVPAVRKAAMGLAWLVYLAALLGGLAGTVTRAVRARRRSGSSQTDPRPVT
jgi:hypothetical protein